MNKKSFDQTKIFLKHIIKKLVLLGFISSPYKLKKHIHQGYNSQVYEITSPSGEFMMHIVKPMKQHDIHRTWEKLQAINTLLRKKTNLPIAEFIFTEKRGSNFITLQTKLPGKTGGKRYILGHAVIDRWFKNKDNYILQVKKIIGKIHKIRLTGYGWPIIKRGKLEGVYISWPEFFQKESPLWLKSLKKMEKQKIYPDNIYSDSKFFVQKAIHYIPKSPPMLIHGDLANPGNILTNNRKITGVLDWEWAMIGDPAWEFCDPGWEKIIKNSGLNDYFRLGKMNELKRLNFVKRIILYCPFWCLWTSYVHAEDKDPLIYETLHMLIRDAIKKAKEIYY